MVPGSSPGGPTLKVKELRRNFVALFCFTPGLRQVLGVLSYFKSVPLVTSAKVIKVSEFKVFPNPATGRVFINLDEPAEIGIYSILGQLVKQQLVASSKNYINVSDLHTGIYFVRMMNGYKNTQKLIVRE